MIPTSVHGHMPFVKETNCAATAARLRVAPYERVASKSCDCGLKVEGSLSRKKVLRIGKDQRLDSIPENIKNDILTKDRTWYAVVRALFRKGSKKKGLGGGGGQDGVALRYSALINEPHLAGRDAKAGGYASAARLCETSRSKSLRLASIEEEAAADTGSTISISLKDADPIRLISLVDANCVFSQLSLSDQLKRKATSTLLKAHEDVASLSSSSSSSSASSASSDDGHPGSSAESLSTTK